MACQNTKVALVWFRTIDLFRKGLSGSVARHITSQTHSDPGATDDTHLQQSDITERKGEILIINEILIIYVLGLRRWGEALIRACGKGVCIFKGAFIIFKSVDRYSGTQSFRSTVVFPTG